MQPIVYHMAVSVDGYIAGPNGELDQFLFTGDHVAEYLAAISSSSVAVMGRKTYQLALDQGVTDPYPGLKTYVFSRSLTISPDPRVTLTSGPVAPVLESLRKQPGNGIIVVGGANLAQQLLTEKLLNEIVIKVNPVLFGNGLPLFEAFRSAAKLDLLESKTHNNGVVVLRYRVADANSARG